MKQIFLMLALVAGAISVNAQETVPQPSTGDLYSGLTRKIEYDRMIPPYGVEVSFNKTVHVIFPSSVRYVDLGSANIIAGKADGSENVIRVKAAVQEQVIYPVRAYRYNTRISGKKSERTVFALPKFTIPDGKHLIVELFEKNDGRHQRFTVENEDITRARIINDFLT
jgi:hypothetical protein